MATVDPAQWPSIAHVPSGRAMGLRSRRAEAKFAKACMQAGLDLDPNGQPDLVVDHEAMFARIAAHGWIGLAEAYMAGEWRTQTPVALIKVLSGLIESGYNPRTSSAKADTRFIGGDVPPELVARYAGDGMSSFAGHFSTGVPTTERRSVKSFSPSAGKRGEPANYFVSVTNFSEPLSTEKLDLADAQRRSVGMLLDAAGVHAGSHIAELPSSGGAVAIAAAGRQATVDSLVTDPGTVPGLRERLTLAGVDDSVHINVVQSVQQALARREGRYDAVVSVETLETLPMRLRPTYTAVMDELLTRGGRAVIQTVVATEKLTPVAASSLESLRAYVWPALEYGTKESLRRLVDKHSGLRVIGETHAPEHLALSLGHQRTTFQGQLREAAADGFDAVYRRLWTWQLALREALARLGMLDAVQYTLAHKHRRGVR
ncbi:class I SAM-dependent methyltransferase [Corynebacterium sp. CCUG 71335]|nr:MULTISPECIES: class I SAM-dependent methyltransferase [unclassified Corynebacterium]MCQ4620523.1 class I SAM-dependent methyltransferase [Corynebacterium sp. CCUG 71335]MCQ4622118.1 class I SAM-dependent methyltransferase [Corynebacterium sp. CCUG 70398]